jgi:competence protein ComEC
MDYKAGMFIYAIAFLLGVILVQQLAVLPETSTLFLLSGFASLCLVFHAYVYNKNRHVLIREITLIITFILLIILGFIFTSYYSAWQLSSRLNEDLIAQNIVISGTVSSIPVTDNEVQRFEFSVESRSILTAETISTVTKAFPKKIRLSWYYGQPVNAGEKWQLEVRLKPPHGFMNPGGFDYEAWLFQHGIHATGYVRKSNLNKRHRGASGSINHIRQTLSKRIDTVSKQSSMGEMNSYSLIKALAIGDKSSISILQWRVLTNTGTSHLMAISGLHIGLASLFAYLIIRHAVPVFIMKRIPAQHVALIAGLFTAFLYALIAGLSVPTQRAIIMLFVLSVMILIRRNHRPVDALGFALMLVLLIDPLAVLSAGFWFSFSAVSVIFISITSTHQQASHKLASQRQNGMDDSIFIRIFIRVKLVLKQWVWLQLLISLFLLPLSLFMFQQVSLVSPVANLLLIPYVSFLVVPLVLLAIIFSFLLPSFSALLFTLAAALLDFIWPLLSYLSSLPYAVWLRGDIDVNKLLAATFAILLLFYAAKISERIFSTAGKQHFTYASWALRLLSCLLFLPLLITHDADFSAGEYQLTVLDVGQGSAAVIRTQNHVAVFDAGAKFSDRLNAGSGVVIPYLRSQGVQSLDRLIISHGDSDHIGGAQAIIDEYPELILIGQDIEDLQTGNKQTCVAGVEWHWDGVDFVFLSPEINDVSSSKDGKRNNHSCVLQVTSVAGSILLTGDIEKKTEKRLLEKYGQQLASDVFIVPHHGSNTSSSMAFIQAVDSKISLISAGYKNRYRLPDRRVVARYRSDERDFLQTDRSGAITIRLLADTGFTIEKYREKAGRYWHHAVSQ